MHTHYKCLICDSSRTELKLNSTDLCCQEPQDCRKNFWVLTKASLYDNTSSCNGQVTVDENCRKFKTPVTHHKDSNVESMCWVSIHYKYSSEQKQNEMVCYVGDCTRLTILCGLFFSSFFSSLKDYCQKNINTDPLITPVDKKENPWAEKSKCSIL